MPFIKRTTLSLLSGLLAGTSTTVFLYALDWTTQTRLSQPHFLWLLPFVGLLTGWLYLKFGKEVHPGTNLILDQIHDPKSVIPARMAPLILGSTLLSHLSGASTGREGVAVQLGASLSDQLTPFFKLNNKERSTLLMAGAGAGFGAAMGAPWAGMIFGMEIVQKGRLKLHAWYECLIASLTAYTLTILLHAPHSQFPKLETPEFSWSLLFWIMIAAIIFGLAASSFIFLTHFLEHKLKVFSKNPFLPFFGGTLLLALYHFEGSFRFAGLGIEQIQNALTTQNAMPTPSPNLNLNNEYLTPLFKIIFTSLSVATGFKGGEFIPLVFIGTTLGAALSAWIPVSSLVLSALGFVSVFAAASKTPLACTLLAAQIFGISYAPYALIATWISTLCTGKYKIYSSQR